MNRKLGKHVYSEVTRHGKRVYYYRNARGLRIRLPDIGSSDFGKAVRLARESNLSIPLPKIDRPSFARTQRQRVGRTLQSIIQGARQRASHRGLPFDLDLDWALAAVEAQQFKCPLTSIPFFMDCQSNRKVHPFSPSLDRIEPNRGYVRDNVRIVVFAVNIMLMDWGPIIFERVMSGYRYTKGTKTRPSIPCNDNPSARTKKIASKGNNL